MRTTIDMPTVLYKKLKEQAAVQNTTMRDLMIHAVENTYLEKKPKKAFRLRMVSVGPESPARKQRVSSNTINQAIDEIRNPSFRR